MKESGMTEEKVKEGNMALIFGLSFVFACFLSIIMWAQVLLIGGGGEETHGQDPYLTFKHGSFYGALMGLFEFFLF